MSVEASSESAPAARGTLSTLRWLVLALVVLAGALNYVDRQIIALLKPVLSEHFGWNDRDYGHIVSAFQFAAAAAYVFAGWFVDRIGVRWGYPLAVVAWSLVAMAHAAARTVAQFVVIRMLLGATEAVNTPAAVKTLAERFPVRERSVAFGIMNTGPNIGAVVTPLIVPLMALAYGWQMAFVLTGAAGLVWAVLWFAVYRSDKSALEPVAVATPAPASATPAADVPWSVLLRDRRTWAIAGTKLLIDPVWWFLLFWLPDFMSRVFGLDLRTFGPPLAVIYAMASVGSLTGGMLPSYFLRNGWSLDSARKTTLIVSALLVLPIPLSLVVAEYWQAVVIVGIALAAHQSFSTNIFALTADVFPSGQVGRVIGFGALVGNLGGLAILEITGIVLDRTGQYWPMFTYCAIAYIAGAVLIRVLLPKIEEAKAAV